MIRKQKKPKTRRQILERDITNWTRFYVKARVDGQCFYEGKDKVRCSGYPCWGHIMHQKDHKRLKWDLKNLECECGGHNLWHKYNEGEFHNFWRDLDPKRFEYLYSLKNVSGKFDFGQLELMLIDIKQKCEREGLLTDENIKKYWRDK
jgi:hypothetical protein